MKISLGSPMVSDPWTVSGLTATNALSVGKVSATSFTHFSVEYA